MHQSALATKSILLSLAFLSGLPAILVGQPAIPIRGYPSYPTIPSGAPRAVFDSEAIQDDDDAAADETLPIIDPDRSAPELDPREMRFTMLDGSVFTGQLDRDSLSVETEFGTLVIPVDRIKRLRPGLRSYPQIAARVDTLIEQLGANEFNTREQARKSLLEYRLQVRDIVADALKREESSEQPNMERVRQLQEIRQQLDTMTEETDLLGEVNVEEPWIDLDTVETDSFVIVGAVEDHEFTMQSKYGPLSLRLQDVQEADRMFGQKQAVARGLTVDGTNLAQLDYKSSGIRVEAGDRITVNANGQITMTPWGSNQIATPDGNSYFGMYNQFPGGSLLAKIGEGGEEQLVGAHKTFVARNSGILSFAIAMQNDYSSGYQYPGRYRLQIKVEPK